MTGPTLKTGRFKKFSLTGSNLGQNSLLSESRALYVVTRHCPSSTADIFFFFSFNLYLAFVIMVILPFCNFVIQQFSFSFLLAFYLVCFFSSYFPCCIFVISYFCLFSLCLFVFLFFCLDIMLIKCLQGLKFQKSLAVTDSVTDWPRSGIELSGQLKDN